MVKSALSEQEVVELEKRLIEELKQEPVKGTAAKVSLGSLRDQAQKLSPQRRQEIEREIADLFPPHEVSTVASPAKGKKPAWKKWIAGVAAALLLFSLAPTAVRGAVDIPGLGVWIQQVALRDTGLEWAFEHGYMQGTVAQISKNGVKLRVLGVVADPVQTTVIYLIQGVDMSANDSPAKPIRVGDEPPTGPQRQQPGVVIRTVNGQGASSWYDSPLRTPIGLVGTTHTRPLVESTGELELQLLLPDGSHASLTLEVSREEVSRLSQEYALNLSQEVDGTVVTVHKAVITPSQLAVEYTLHNGHSVQGAIPEEFRRRLVQNRDTILSSKGDGSYVDGQWLMRDIFARPRTLTDLSYVIPALSQTVEASLEWDTAEDQALAYYEDTSVTLKRFSQSAAGVNIELQWKQHNGLWNLKGFELTDAAGKVHVLGLSGSTGTYWSPGQDNYTLGYTFELPDNFAPVSLRATSVEKVIAGNWTFALELGVK